MCRLPLGQTDTKTGALRSIRGAGVACRWSLAHRPVRCTVPHLLPEASGRDPPSPLCRSPVPGLCVFQRPHPEPFPNTPPSQRSRPGSETQPPACSSEHERYAQPACLLPAPKTGAPWSCRDSLCAGCIGPALILLRRVCGGKEGSRGRDGGAGGGDQGGSRNGQTPPL